MNDDLSIKERLLDLNPRLKTRDSDDEPTDDMGICGWLHGIRDRSLFLELRLKTGNILAMGYSWLEKAEFDPTEGITLFFVGQTVQLQGRNLIMPLRNHNRLFDGILRHRVTWVQEADHPFTKDGDKKPMLTKIMIK